MLKLTIWLGQCEVFSNYFPSGYSEKGGRHKHKEGANADRAADVDLSSSGHRCTPKEPDQIVQIAKAHILQLSNHLWFEIPINERLEDSYTDQTE